MRYSLLIKLTLGAPWQLTGPEALTAQVPSLDVFPILSEASNLQAEWEAKLVFIHRKNQTTCEFPAPPPSVRVEASQIYVLEISEDCPDKAAFGALMKQQPLGFLISRPGHLVAALDQSEDATHKMLSESGRPFFEVANSEAFQKLKAFQAKNPEEGIIVKILGEPGWLSGWFFPLRVAILLLALGFVLIILNKPKLKPVMVKRLTIQTSEDELVLLPVTAPRQMDCCSNE